LFGVQRRKETAKPLHFFGADESNINSMRTQFSFHRKHTESKPKLQVHQQTFIILYNGCPEEDWEAPRVLAILSSASISLLDVVQ
jgi:hypothetical protein